MNWIYLLTTHWKVWAIRQTRCPTLPRKLFHCSTENYISRKSILWTWFKGKSLLMCRKIRMHQFSCTTYIVCIASNIVENTVFTDLGDYELKIQSIFFRRITDYMYERYRGPRGPLFSLHDRLSPVVSLAANFDSLLVPKDHVSRKKSDSYYINSQH